MLFGVRIHDVGLDEASTIFARWLAEDVSHVVVTPNPEFLLAARRDAKFAQRLNDADLSLPDGTGLRFASAALADTVITHRVPGVAALELLAERAMQAGKKLLLLGAEPAISLAAASLQQQFATLDVAVLDPGAVGRAGELPADVNTQIAKIAPAVIAVGLGQEKQEACIAENVAKWPSVRIAIGVGGAFAMIGGVLDRAPKLLRRAGLEWTWRVLLEPRRAGRIWRAAVVFPAVVIWTTLRERRFLRAVAHTVPEIFKQLIGR